MERAHRATVPSLGWRPPRLGEIKLLPVDYDYIEKEAAGIKKRVSEIFQ